LLRPSARVIAAVLTIKPRLENDVAAEHRKGDPAP
jgi:hypothetical protein